MVFTSPSWVPNLPIDPPDSIPIAEFMKNEAYGRRPIAKSRHPFTCGITGRSYSSPELFERSESFARALAKRLQWQPNEGTPWDKVLAIFSLNTIDFVTAIYGVHRLNGIATPANAAYSSDELTHQLKASGAKALVTCTPLLEVALEAAKNVGISFENIYLFDIPRAEPASSFKHTSVEDLINEGSKLQELERLQWAQGQGARQTAFLCFSSGTSGLPKAVMISHRNVISNVLQHVTYDSVARRKKGVETQAVTGFLPFSHIYGLVIAAHTCTWRGDQIIVLPKFEFNDFLKSVQEFKIRQLLVVPPIIIQVLRFKDICAKYDLSSVRFVYCGAAPLGEETISDMKKLYPDWTIAQAYGMTETSTVVTSSSEDDVFTRGSGSLLPGAKAKIIDLEGNEVTEYDKPGELLVQAPSVVLGYLNNEKATSETFVHHEDGRYIRTGDEAIVTLAPSGHEHIVIVDRIKELIKVKGHQVAPAELEAHILTSPHVFDCAVIQVPDERSGEVPKAFVVKSSLAESLDEGQVANDIMKHVADNKASYKQLRGGVEFLEVIPKSPSGKILRRLLRDKEREKRRAEGAKL
ncbi:putative phenylacetyl-CoA ligase [Fusarium proliferatum ET1]|uniref:Probable phenylacetyl-CoA ligase n=1 Tax=Fusarium proliferatum (strain ET1) TaxID=1227346 RepID=A0A1L7VCT2_FUSPR|nr:putative phenylacetyl-CoA ligase [Fusarium proliferatum ET1]CZR37516.1 probable phenylacetyl-CoA ligase [Fusarium proliferatum ET1]